MSIAPGDTIKVLAYRQPDGRFSLLDSGDTYFGDAHLITPDAAVECKVLAITTQNAYRNNSIIVDLTNREDCVNGWVLNRDDVMYWGISENFVGKTVWFTSTLVITP